MYKVFFEATGHVLYIFSYTPLASFPSPAYCEQSKEHSRILKKVNYDYVVGCSRLFSGVPDHRVASFFYLVTAKHMKKLAKSQCEQNQSSENLSCREGPGCVREM